jgi:hypothetical protein
MKVTKFIASTPSNEEKMFFWPNAFSDYNPKPIPESVVV